MLVHGALVFGNDLSRTVYSRTALGSIPDGGLECRALEVERHQALLDDQNAPRYKQAPQRSRESQSAPEGSIMAKLKRKIQPHNEASPGAKTAQPPLRSPQSRRWPWMLRPWFLLSLLILLALGVVMAPAVVCRTPLRDTVLRLATGNVRGSVEVGELSIGWFSSLNATDVKLLDQEGNLIAHLPSIVGDKGLAGMLTSGRRLGTIKLDQPKLQLVVRGDGSNLEDALAYFLEPSDEPTGGANVDLTVEISAGSVSIHDLLSGRTSTVQPINLLAHLPRLATEPLQISIAGAVTGPENAGTFSLQMAAEDAPLPSGAMTNIGTLALKAERVPMEVAVPILRRLMPGTQLAGQFFSDLRVQWGIDASGKLRRLAEGRLSARELITAGKWSGGEQLRLEAIDIPCQIAWEEDQLRVNQLTLTSDVGQLTFHATIPQADKLIEAHDTATLLTAIGRGTTDVTGQLNLARLAQLLPQTFRLRGDVQVTSGTVNLQLSGRPEADGSAWQGHVEAGRLVAQHAGREITWDQPLVVTLAAHDRPQSFRVDRLQCLADFMKLEGAGSPESFQWNGAFDLNRLAAELSKFIDLQGIRLAGQGTTQGGWQHAASGEFQARGQAQLTGFELAAPGMPAWTEERLELAASANGSVDADNQLQNVQAAQAQLTSGSDRLTATLKGPVANPGIKSEWPIDIQLRGELTSWLRRMMPAIGSLPGMEISGKTEWSAQARYARSVLDIESSDLTIQPFHLRGNGLYIDEPVVKLRTAGRWSGDQALVEVREAVLETSAVIAKMQAGKLALSTAASAQNNAQLQIDGELSRLYAWLHDPVQSAALDMTGTLRCIGRLGHQSGRTTANLETTVENLLVTPRGGRQWREPVVKLLADAAYDHAADRLDLTRAELNADMLQFQASGRVSDVNTRRWLETEGKLNYDLAKVQRAIQTYLGLGVQMAGSETRSFSFAGPLVAPANVAPSQRAAAWASQFTGKADLGWQWLDLYGFQINRGELAMTMRDSVARISPLDVAVGDTATGAGRLRLAPEIRFGGQSPELWMPAGELISQAELTPAMCNQGLQYIAPLLAGVGQTRGKFSLQMDQCRLPLAEPGTGEMAGQLTIHSVEVTPGPLAQMLSSFAGRGGTMRIANESKVPFRLADGRIYHQGFEVSLGDIVIRTQGWVATDQSVSLVAEMPVPASLLGNSPLAASLQNRAIRVPIGGTLQRPQIDQQALGQVLGQMVRESTVNATENALRDGLNRGLDQLFGPPPNAVK
jgi:hypothetical protein